MTRTFVIVELPSFFKRKVYSRLKTLAFTPVREEAFHFPNKTMTHQCTWSVGCCWEVDSAGTHLCWFLILFYQRTEVGFYDLCQEEGVYQLRCLFVREEGKANSYKCSDCVPYMCDDKHVATR